MTRYSLGVSVLGVLASACLLDEVEDGAGGVFVCATNEDCPSEQQCLVQRCESVPAPRVEIRFPEATDIVAVVVPGTAPTMMTLQVSVGGNDLVLVDPLVGRDPVAGEGFVELWVDGEAVAELTSGDLVAGVVHEVELLATPGAHRIAAVARRADGAAYDNDEAVGTRVVWVDDGRPHVAVTSPWPGEVFAVNEVEIPITIATLNFGLIPAAGVGPEPSGHAHLHYDDPFPSCPDDPACDCCYVAVASPKVADLPLEGFLRTQTQTVVLPASGSGAGEVTALLRTPHHTVYVGVDGQHVYDSVTIQRAASARLDKGAGA